MTGTGHGGTREIEQEQKEAKKKMYKKEDMALSAQQHAGKDLSLVEGQCH